MIKIIAIITEHIAESITVALISLFALYTKRHKALEQGVQALLRTEIIAIYNKYIDVGYCPIYAKENIEALYKQYKALGGNGTAAAMTEVIRKMPTERKENNNESKKGYIDTNNSTDYCNSQSNLNS